MADEDVAPSRAEIDSMLWACAQTKMTEDQVKDMVTQYLKDRNVSDRGITAVLSDLHTYSNYSVEAEDAAS